MRPTRMTLALACASASILGVVVSATPASAAGCYAYSCHGYDLYHFGCTYTSTTADSAVTYDGRTAVATVYNRYSGGCRSNWAEAALTPAALAAGDTMLVGIITHDFDSRGNSESMDYPSTSSNRGALQEYPAQPYYGGAASAYTDMVDGTNLTEAWIHVFDKYGTMISDNGQAVQ